MKKQLRIFSILLVSALLGAFAVIGQNTWPREISIPNGGVITIYQPQPESFKGNKLSGRSAVSVKPKKDAEPVFGAVWVEATTVTDRDTRMVDVESIVVKQVKFPGVTDSATIEKFSKLVESEVPKWNLSISMEQLTTALEKEGIQSASDLKTDPPKILYSNKISTLVLIDGEPKLEKDKNIDMEKVVNCPFPILKEGSSYYLFIGSFWYVSKEIKSGWKQATQLPAKIVKLDDQIKKQKKEQEAANKSVAAAAKEVKASEEIVVSTVPAELLQTDGEPEYKTLEGTSLLYISNSPNVVFKDINSQKTFVLFTGRWYSSSSLKGPWSYTAADNLPEDFAKIKEGGDKDNVLASVAGTDAANEAVLDAMIPQTASVDRKTATVKEQPKYDGTPQFEKIQGTNLELAINTSSTVLRQNGVYYVVENGIWFESNSYSGPWRVSTKRPTDVENIPASSSAYNTKYVEIYDVQPDVVVVGYTPGYMGSYVYGPTVIYGTGYPYNPWYGAYYYPRPVTYGFGMSYNPWTGWSMNFGMSWGPWHLGVSSGGGMYFGFGFGGYCGHPGYYPPYRPPYYGGGYYGGGYHGGNNHWGNNNVNIGGGNTINIGEINVGNGDRNLYKKAGNGVSTRDVKRQPGTGNRDNNAVNRPSAKPGTNNKLPGGSKPEAMPARPGSGSKDVYADKNGNVFKRDQDGNWNQNNGGNKWQQTTPDRNKDLNKMQQQRDKGSSRDRSYQSNRQPQTKPATRPAQTSRPASAAKPATRPAGGGARRGR